MQVGNLLNALQGFDHIQPMVNDQQEIFSTENTGDVVVEIAATEQGQLGVSGSPPGASLLRLIVDRQGRGVHAEVLVGDLKTNRTASHDYDATVLRENSAPFADLAYLRRALAQLQNCFYIGPFRNAINLGAGDPYFDIRTGSALISAWGQWKSGASRAQNETAIRLTEDIRRIFGLGRLEINENSERNNLQVIIDGHAYRLDEHGSGLAHFIIVLANVAIRERPSYILIDEPELGLHPSLQMDFLTTLGSYATEGVVFATHSMGLARSAANRLYSFRRVAQGDSEVRDDVESTPNLAEFLGELSYSSYRDIGFRHVLLVEGPHDLRTVQQWLRQYGKEHEVVLLPLGGSQNIAGVGEAQLHEVKRITDRVAALIDSERTAAGVPLDKARQEFVDACGRTDVLCKVLDRRAVENYLSDRAIKLDRGAAYHALGQFEKLGDASPNWDKAQNWRIARLMTKDELDATDLGPFLASL